MMIVGQSSHFTSCYWRFNLCTAIFYRRVWSMNSKEWLQTFYAFKLFSPRVFNFDLHKIKKVILWALLRELGKRCVWSVFASRAFANIPIIFQSSIKGNIYHRVWQLLIRQIFSHYCSKNRKADDKVQFLPFAVRIREAVYLTYIYNGIRYNTFQIRRSLLCG